MTKHIWFSRGKNDHKAGSSFGARRHPASRQPRTAPPPRNRVYVELDVARAFAEQGVPLPWSEVNLPFIFYFFIFSLPIAAYVATFWTRCN
jgi:hypothetical protein